jgi:hypothetical protein
LQKVSFQEPCVKLSLAVAVIIASKGRPAELSRWIDHLGRQTHKPVAVIFSVASPDDLPTVDLAGAGITPIVCGRAGSCLQRNAALAAIKNEADIVAFFDDDYVPSSLCIERMREFFASFPSVVAANGILLADGINSRGIPYEEALAMVRYHDSQGLACHLWRQSDRHHQKAQRPLRL